MSFYDDAAGYDRSIGRRYESDYEYEHVPIPLRRSVSGESYSEPDSDWTDDEDLDIHIHRGRGATPARFFRNSSPLREHVYTSPPRSRSRHRPRGRSLSPLRSWERERARERSVSRPRYHSYYEESPPPPPLFANNYRRSYYTLPHVPPIDRDGNPLNLDVNLVTLATDEVEPGWSNRKTEFTSKIPESLSLESSRGFTDEADVEKIILTLQSKDDSGKIANLRWIHLQQDHMSIKSLENLITQTPDLHNDDMLIALHLLREVAEKSEAPYIHGHYLKTTLLRGESHSNAKPEVSQPDRHCTFINFPYFSFQAPSSILQQESTHYHLPLGLLQTVHLLESTKVRDAEQAICKLNRPNRFGKVIHVSQLWSISIGSDILITYSTRSLSTMRGENIEIQKSISKNQSGPSVLRVMDPYQRLFFFSIDLCKTWFELEELVYTQCELCPRDYVQNEFDLFLKDKKPLTGAQWPTVLASEESPFIDIFVHFKEDYKSNDSDSGSDDVYLQRERRPTIRRHNILYAPSVRHRSTRDTHSGRGTSYFYADRRPELRPRSTVDTGREVPTTRRSDAHEGRRHPKSRVNAPGSLGTAAADDLTIHEVGIHQPDNEKRGKGHDQDQASSGHEENSSLTLDPARHTQLDSQRAIVSFHIEEGERVIVAEPESYYSSSEPGHPRSYTRDSSKALVLYGRQRVTNRVERPLPPFRQPRIRPQNETSYPPVRRALPSARGGSTRTDDLPNINVRSHRLPAPHRAGLLIDNYNSHIRRPAIVDIRPRFEDKRSGRQYVRRDAYLGDDDLYIRRQHHYRHNRHRPATGGIISNSTNDSEIEADIYYMPKRKNDAVPSLNINNGSNAFKAKDASTESKPVEASNDASNFESSRSDSNSFEKPTVNSQTERRSGSFNSSRPTPMLKPFVLPILMWPTGPAEDFRKINNDGIQNEDFVHRNNHHQSPKSDMNGPPRTSNTVDNNSQRQGNDSSLAEVLDRVYNSLLTDKSSNHDMLFREMETANRKDATFKIPEQLSTIPQKKDADDTEDGAQGVGSKYDLAEGLLNAEPVKNLTGEHSKVLEYQTRLLQFSTTANNLLECFIPADYSSPVIGRYYGSVRSIIKTIDESQKHNTVSQLYTNQGTVWIIQDIGDAEYLEKHHLQPLSKSLNSCSKCRENFSYKSEIDASNHLLEDHFPSDRRPSVAVAMLWIRRHQPLADRRRCQEHVKILRNCCNHLNVIYKGVQGIRDGVCTIGMSHNPRYRLPKVLVVAFRKLILFLVYASHVLQLITKHSETWTSRDWRLLNNRELSDKISNLQYIGGSVEDAIDQGKIDLTLMIRTQDYTQSIKRYEAVGPQYILTMVLGNLQTGVDCKDLVEVYKEHVARLSFQVSQFPRRRLLRSLKYVEEEIDAIFQILSQQNNLFVDLGKVLDPQSFHKTTESRVSMYDLEMGLINKSCFKSAQRLAELMQLQKRVQRLMDDTKTSVEINDDDHGKAILVFTVVTLVFLPLSFVASFLGMNTIDIRNQTTSQTLYWIVALPLTAGVMAMALVIGYKYETMRDYMERYMGKVKNE